MKICVNGRFLTRRTTGVDRFALELLRAVDRLISMGRAQNLELRILVPSGTKVANPFHNISLVQFGRTSGQFWEQFELPFALFKDELLLSLCNTGPILVRNQIVAIHDAAIVKIPQSFGWRFKVFYRLLLPLLGNLTKKTITVSQFSKSEIAACFMIPDSKISVVSNSAEHIKEIQEDGDAIEEFGLGKRPFLLAVSSMAVHKNFQIVLKALALIENPEFDVAIVGGFNSKVFAGSSQGSDDNVKYLGYVSDAQLKSLYRAARCFVFPSVYEGFGIPPLEAMASGCPVIASRSASIPEVCGKAALFFDPYNEHELVSAINSVFDRDDLREELVQLGRDNAARYSWESSARSLLRIVEDVCK